jgi:NAD-dependent dihydropyrimidine dehydrogenase PreA subunit
MPYFIAEPCIGVKDGACIDVCPVDCIYTTAEDEQMFIQPDECIDCAACEPVCPVSAIFAEDQLPEKWKAFAAKNRNYFTGKDMAQLKEATKVAPRKLKEAKH